MFALRCGGGGKITRKIKEKNFNFAPPTKKFGEFALSERAKTFLEAKARVFNDDNTDTATLDLKLDWDRLKVETRTGEGIITIDDTLEVQLVSDDQGNLIVDDMMLIVFGL